MGRKVSMAVVAVAVLVASCTSEPTTIESSTSAPTTSTVPDTTTTGPPADDTTTTTDPGEDDEAAREAARTTTGLEVTGPEEVVFDWTTDACEPEHIPDITARAIRSADGLVSLYVAHYVTYRMVGADLDSVTTDCSAPVHESDFDPDPATFNDSEWLASPWTEDGETVWAIVHNEYRGDTHGIAGQCPSGDRLTCLDTSITMAKSTDGGRTFVDIAAPPGHLVATQPYPYDDEGRPTGFRQPSNLVPGDDGYWYVFSNVSEYPSGDTPWEDQWVCVMRTDDLDDPGSWRYWDGTAFGGSFVNPYVDTPASDRVGCAPLAFPSIGNAVQESVVWSDVLDAWVMIGVGNDPSAADEAFGFYYATSTDLLEWTRRRLLVELPLANTVADNANELYYAYPSLLDPDSESRSFDTFDDEGYLYLARVNEGGNSLDRDLVRFPVAVVTRTIEPPAWTFETDAEGWNPTWDVTDPTVADGIVTFTATGDDPYVVGPSFDLPALGYGTVTIRMRVSAGSTGQVFFATAEAPDHAEARSVVFALRPGEEFHEYVLDLAAEPGWTGTIVNLRLDPTDTAGATIEIDEIIVSE